MKTPEEIKKGLECCRPIWKSDHFKTCDSACPYVNEGHFCRTILYSDALALIRQLEADKKILEIQKEAAFKMAERLEQERDALLTIGEGSGKCDT